MKIRGERHTCGGKEITADYTGAKTKHPMTKHVSLFKINSWHLNTTQSEIVKLHQTGQGNLAHWN